MEILDVDVSFNSIFCLRSECIGGLLFLKILDSFLFWLSIVLSNFRLDDVAEVFAD